MNQSRTVIYDRQSSNCCLMLTAIASAQSSLPVYLAQYIDEKMRRSAVERQLEILARPAPRLARMDSGWWTRFPCETGH